MAPSANPSRLRAVCRNVIVSAGESKPISWVPGIAPARWTPRRARVAGLSSPQPVSAACPKARPSWRNGGSPRPTLRTPARCEQLRGASGRCGKMRSRRPNNSGSRPGRCHAASTTLFTCSICSCQPVVPITRFTPSAAIARYFRRPLMESRIRSRHRYLGNSPP